MSNAPDFVAIKKRYDERLTPGQRAEIRRAADPDDPALIFATGRLFRDLLGPWDSSYRLVWFLPWVRHRDGAASVGKQFANARKISPARLFQMMRSEEPTDLQHLRRLCRQVEPTVDWQDFGWTLVKWGRDNKQKIVEDYFWTGGGEKT